jgi:tRNA pseudouridine55 synthase
LSALTKLFFPDGVIVVDKPAGPTSHDVVAVARRATHVKKVGHTGTLDPLASGVLPLVLGRATRLAQFLSSAEKEYEADIELGVNTTTFDRAGQEVERSQAARPVSELTRSDVEAAVAEFRGTFLQVPPLFSAKKVDGDRAYDLARQHEPVTLRPAEVSAHSLDITEWNGARLRLRLVCSAGFYVRSLAQAIGERLGTGAHLARLVRTRSGDFTLDSAISLADLDQRPGEAAARVIPLNHLLPRLPALTLTVEGASLASRGGFISAGHLDGPQLVPESGKVRLMHPDGRLLAIAERWEGGGSPLSALLHPGVVLE